MSPKLIRLMFVATVVTGLSAPMLGASAAGQARSVDAWNPPRNFEVPGAADPRRIDINKDDTVSWVIWEGEHTVTAKDQKQWNGDGSGETPLTPESPRYTKTFTKPGDYVYYCSLHGGIGEDGKPFGMWGVVHVIDPTPTTQPPTTQPPATQPPATQPPATVPPTTRPGATPPATTATAPTTRPGPTAPATTPTTAKPSKDKKKDAKEDETTTTSTAPVPPPPIDLPNEAIVPTLPGFGAAPGSDAEAPIDTPEGEAVALLKPKKNSGGDAVKLLIVSGIGLGALGVGTAGYKYANRSSKYFPA